MCEPTTLMAMSLAISGVSAIAQSAAAVDSANKQNAAVEQNSVLANDAYLLKMRQENQRLYEVGLQKQQKEDEANMKSLKASSKALAVAAGAGVQGKNVDELIANFDRAEGVYTQRLDQQYEAAARQSDVNKLAYQNEALGRINSMQPVSASEVFAAGIQPLANFGLEYANYKDRLANV
jgi:copper homeostasis protein CutC